MCAGKRYLIVGTGSVGLNIIDALVARGEMHVAGFDIVAPKRRAKGVTFVQGSVNDLPTLLEACKDVDVVFATFALIRYYERYSKPSHCARSAALSLCWCLRYSAALYCVRSAVLSPWCHTACSLCCVLTVLPRAAGFSGNMQQATT